MQNVNNKTTSKKQALDLETLDQVSGGLSIHFEKLGFKWTVGAGAFYLVTEAWDVVVSAIDAAIDPI